MTWPRSPLPTWQTCWCWLTGEYKVNDNLKVTPSCLLRYEVDDLKDVCEATLLAKVDSDCCFALLALADQFQV